MKKPKPTLRQRAIISIFMTYFLLTIYFIYFIHVNQHRTLEEDALKGAVEAVRLVSFDISRYLLRKDKMMLQKLADHVLDNRNIEYIRFKDIDGKMLLEGGVRGK
ncbi:MAG: hypothetical protein Q8P24_09175, partial [Desulfobacterales bacterium]|nr:hypothetical protein [Desulfobacterales bacterium]